MSKNTERLDDFFQSVPEEIMNHSYEDQLARMQEDYNRTIDECVEYGSFPYEEGERLKAEYVERMHH